MSPVETKAKVDLQPFGSTFDADGRHLNLSTNDNSPLSEDEIVIAEKPTHALIEVTDVGDFPMDFDAYLTIMTRHLVNLESQVFSVGSNPQVLKYAADFLVDLPDIARDRIQRAVHQAAQERRDVPADVVEAHRAWEQKTLRVLLNYAPRNQKKSEQRNGEDFYLAIANGVEVYAVPPVVLQYLKLRDRIDALFRIPTKGHPLTTSLEQFRSSLYGKTAHEAREHLELVWRRNGDTADLDKVIDPLEHDEVAFVDQPYNNRRIITPDAARAQERIEASKQVDGTVLVRVGTSRVRAYVADSLSKVPEGQWGLWFNPADVEGAGSGAAYYELSRRWEPGKDWSNRGQFSSYYLARKDRKIGTGAEILPKDSRRHASDITRSKIAGLWRAA
jgi:hypothetical protein